jgi:hypothetical protein
VGAEIGVHVGDFSQRILETARPFTLLLIDPWKYEPDPVYDRAWYGGGNSGMAEELEGRYRSVTNRFANQIRSAQVCVLRQDSISALSALSDDYLDFVYIDGNHLYEFVKLDLELSLRKVKPGGYITGDDYGPGNWWDGGVKKAVDEFGWNNGVEMLWIKKGQFAFQKKQTI